MVFDATASAFPPLTTLDNQSALNPPVLPAPKPSAAQYAPDVSNRPIKRRRTLQTDVNRSLAAPSPGRPSVSPAIDFDALDAARRRSSARVMSLWESLAARYARPLDEDDEIDILTGKIYKDRGVLRAASERGWRIGSFGEAIEVEPIIGASETETETATSECDDEGEEGDAAGDVDEADEDDPFESWSYDFQYRKLPPPRPELSAQDAEDLAGFLEAERAIQEENESKGGDKQESVSEDEVEYLGDSLHNQDGALRDDGSDDEEFSSFAVDDSTVQPTKQEENEDDDVEPMSSILGVLAIGTTPQKRPSGPSCMDSAVGTGVVEPVSAHGQNAHTRARAPSTPTTRKVRPGVDPSASVRPESEVGVEEELIVIESDTDDEVDVDMGSLPKLRSALDVSVLDSAASSPSKGLFLSHGPPRNSNTGGRPGSSAKDLVTKSSALGVQSAPSAPVSSSGMIRHNRISFSAVVASLQASNGSKLEVSASASRSSPASSPSTSAVKPISKRMRSRTGIKTQDTVISFRAGTSASSSLLVSLDGSKTHASTPMATAVNSPSVPSTIQSNPLGGVSSGLSAKASTRPNPVVLQKAAAKTPLRRTNEPQRTLVVTTMEPKSALTQGLESPTKSRKKPLVMEVVLTPLRHASKPILQLAGSPTSTTPTEPLPANFLVSHSGRSPVSTPSPKAKSAIQASNTSKGESDQPSNSAAIISTGVRANHAQKRGRESGEGFKAEDSMLGPQRRAEAVPAERLQTADRIYSCCPPMILGQSQPSACCSIPFGYPLPPPQPSRRCSDSSSQESCSCAHQVQHRSSVHQHQHQHPHTHLPFPLPQNMHSFTANELTEAALKLIHGLGTMHPSGSSGYAHEMWLPPGAHTPYTLPRAGVMQAQAQVGPSVQVLPPKLEPPSSREEIIPDSQEKVPSSQEYERRKGKGNQKGRVEPQLAQPTGDESRVLPPFNTRPPSPQPLPRARATPSRPNITPDLRMGLVSRTLPSCPSPWGPRTPKPNRESSVIDIESDSEDELASFNAGEGSMRWVLPIKDENVVCDGEGLGVV